MRRTFSESFRFPTPTRPVQVTLKKRGPQNEWKDLWKLDVDPKDMFVDTSVPASPGPLLKLLHSGPPAQKVDFLILGDGYTRPSAASSRRTRAGWWTSSSASSPSRSARRTSTCGA